MTYKYDYAHRKWSAAVREAAGGKCQVCGRKPKRLHAHHIYGTDRTEGIALCPTCHDIITLLAGPGRKAHENRKAWLMLLWLVKERKRGHPLE